MSLGRLLRSSFSAYEIAVMARIIVYGLCIAALAAIMTMRIGVALILFLAAVIVGVVLEEHSRCPVCRKPPRRRARGEVGFLLTMMARSHFWPERRCSGCGSALDVVRDD